MKRARQEKSSGGYSGFGGLSSPRRVVVPVLVRDGKACHTGVMPDNSHGNYPGLPSTSSSTSNLRLSSSGGDLSSYPAVSPTSTNGVMGPNGVATPYASSPGPFHSPTHSFDFNPHTYPPPHNQFPTQQLVSGYAPGSYTPAYAVDSPYSAHYKAHQSHQKWPSAW